MTSAMIDQLPDEVLAAVFDFLPLVDACEACCVCRRFYLCSTYPSLSDGALLSKRCRYWITHIKQQSTDQQTLAHVLASHPLLTSTKEEECNELVSLDKRTYPSATTRKIRPTAVARPVATSPSTLSPPSHPAPSRSPSPAPARVPVPVSQLLSLVEIVCSSFRPSSSVRSTRDSHTNTISADVSAPLESFLLPSLDLSRFPFVDAPLIRALTQHMPCLTNIKLADCKLVTDAAVAAIFNSKTCRERLKRLDVSQNPQLLGQGWFDSLQSFNADHQDGAITFALTHLNVSECSSLSPHRLGPVFFSPPFIGHLHVIDARATRRKLIVALVKALPRMSSLRRLDVRGAKWSANEEESRLITQGRYATDDGPLRSPSTGPEQQSTATSNHAQQSMFSFPVRPQPPRYIETLRLGEIEALPGSILNYILRHCTPGTLTHLELARCTSITSSSLADALKRFGCGLKRLDLSSSSAMNDGAIHALLATATSTPPFSTSSSSISSAAADVILPQLTHLDLSNCSATPSLLFSFLVASCPRLRTLLIPALESDQDAPADDAATNEQWDVADDEQQRRAEQDRAAIEEHARDLLLPDASQPHNSSVTHASSSVVDYVHSANLNSSAASPQTSAFSTLHSLSSLHSLTHLDLSRNENLRDSDIVGWAEAMAREQETLATTTLPLTHIDLSHCPHVSNASILAILQLMRPRPLPGPCLPVCGCDERENFEHADAEGSSSSTSSLLLAHECPLVDVSRIPQHWKRFVEARPPFVFA